MSSNAIIQATQKITKASDCRDDTKLIMQPYANWEEYLTPGPISVAIMGELIFISSNVDFSINRNPPKDGFKCLKYPESFRACLMQVCNSGWCAFNEAHKNMDQIRLYTANVPGYIKMSVKILMQEDEELIKTLLPDQLENIENISRECLQLAERTESKFMFVIQLIQEVVEACMNAKQSYSRELENIKIKIEETKLREKASQEANKRADKAFKNMNQQLTEAQQRFTESMNSIPSGWEIIGMNFLEGISNGVNSAISGCVSLLTGESFGNIVGGFINATGPASDPNANAAVTNTRTPAMKNSDPLSANNILSKSEQLLKLTQSFGILVDKDQIKWSEIYDQNSGSAKTDYLKTMFVNIRDSINKENDCEPKQLALKICTMAINICSDIAAVGPDRKCDDGKRNQLIANIQNVMQSAQQFDCKSKFETNSPAFSIKPPQLSQTQTTSQGSKSAGQIATENARLRIEQSRAQLDKVREMYQKSVENMEKNQQELTEIRVTMRNCEVKEIDFDTTIKMLIKGLDAMGRVKSQWEKMVRFFQMVSNIIKTSLSKSLDEFVKVVDKTSATALNYTAKMFVRDMIYSQAFYASNIASLINMISGTYTEVSDKYLMDRVSSLGRLMALDPSKPEFKSERLALQNACEEAQEGIRALVQKNKTNFNRKTSARLATIEGELKAVLPPQSEEEQQKLKKIVAEELRHQDQIDQFV